MSVLGGPDGKQRSGSEENWLSNILLSGSEMGALTDSKRSIKLEHVHTSCLKSMIGV